MARYNRLQGGAPDRTQNSTQDGLDALERSALGPASRNGAPQASNGNQTSRQPVAEGKPTLIAHKLGRAYRGWNVAMKNQGVSFFCPSGERYDRSKYICVQWGAPGGTGSVDAEFWVY
ncbi:MAG: hypothetical protein GY772_02620 [bacterium]|nr:hypothetical protein [bacterium]MCP4239433.1 hypothetical protein [bacterium]